MLSLLLIVTDTVTSKEMIQPVTKCTGNHNAVQASELIPEIIIGYAALSPAPMTRLSGCGIWRAAKRCARPMVTELAVTSNGLYVVSASTWTKHCMFGI